MEWYEMSYNVEVRHKRKRHYNADWQERDIDRDEMAYDELNNDEGQPYYDIGQMEELMNGVE